MDSNSLRDPAFARVHELKTWPEFFEALLKGEKTFELRLNDRNFQTGDILKLDEWDPRYDSSTGRSISKRVTYVMGRHGVGQSAIKEGYVCMGLGEIPHPAEEEIARWKRLAEEQRPRNQISATVTEVEVINARALFLEADIRFKRAQDNIFTAQVEHKAASEALDRARQDYHQKRLEFAKEAAR